MESTTIALPTELKRALELLARRTGRTQAEIIWEALETYVAQNAMPLPRSFGVVANGSFDVAEYESYLKAHWKPDW